MLKWTVLAVKSIHGRRIESTGLLRLPKLYPLAAIRKKITRESTKVAAANSSADQRAMRTGAAYAAIAPITGSRSIHVRSLANITNLSSLHKRDQRKDEYRQHCNSTEEANHIGLPSARLHLAHIATEQRHQSCQTIAYPLDDVDTKSLLDIRDAK